jgi:anti-sigma regulatory factor (Ser/Thr protein kinase)
MCHVQRTVANVSKRTHNADVRDPFQPSDETLLAHKETSGRDGAACYSISGGVKPEVPEIAMPPIESRKEFEFPGVLASVPEHREQVMEFVEQHCHDEGNRLDLLVAIQEALANAALHGCKDDPAKLIHCTVTANPEEITITVRDAGPGFDLELASPDKYVATKLRHGRGICLMRRLVTEVWFDRRGAAITLRKRLNAGE